MSGRLIPAKNARQIVLWYWDQMRVNEREIEQFLFIARISARLRFMSFLHARTRDNFFFYARISARLRIVSFPHERTWDKYFLFYARISARLIQQRLLRFSDWIILSPWPRTLLWPMDWYRGVGDVNFVRRAEWCPSFRRCCIVVAHCRRCNVP